MTVIAGDFEGRRAPYAPISALERFFVKIRDRQLPEVVDHHFLEKLNVASNNEYALLSALKFLNIVDDRGKPTHSYRLLQTTDRFEATLWHLVTSAYKPVFDAGADTWSNDDLVNFFRVSSSPSQAKNAARFFQAVCRLAGHGRSALATEPKIDTPDEQAGSPEVDAPAEAVGRHLSSSPVLLETKSLLLEKLPAVRPEWSAAEYTAICDRFVSMLENLDRS